MTQQSMTSGRRYRHYGRYQSNEPPCSYVPKKFIEYTYFTNKEGRIRKIFVHIGEYVNGLPRGEMLDITLERRVSSANNEYLFDTTLGLAELVSKLKGMVSNERIVEIFKDDLSEDFIIS